MKSPDDDRGAFSVDEETFALVAELEIRKATRLQYPVSMLAIKPVPFGGGELEYQGLARRLAMLISPLIRRTDLIRLSPRSPNLYVLLPDALLADLESIMRRIRDETGRHRMAMNGEPRPIHISLAGACFPSTASTSQDLMTQADKGSVESDSPGSELP